ncbi:MAG: hypothetical protein KBA46_07510 [Candidatus Omnitrophica bacterium]|nr:hypothetical protein [Candidatus Omnitrophota bacterium]
MKKITMRILIMVFLLSISTSVFAQSCSGSAPCPKGSCADGSTYVKSACINSNCVALPQNFNPCPLVNLVPATGYYHPSGGGRVSLFDASGYLYVFNPTVAPKQFDCFKSTTSWNLAGFKPIIGYYFNFTTGPLRQGIHLWDVNGNLRSYNYATGKFDLVSSASKVSLGLPIGFKPKIGYVHGFGGGRIGLFTYDQAIPTELYVYNPGVGKFSRFTNVAQFGFPADFKPVTGYYYKFPVGGILTEGIHLWDGNGVLYAYNATTNLFDNKTLEKESFGLSTDFKPRVGYHFNVGLEGGALHLWDNQGQLYAYTVEQNQFEVSDMKLPPVKSLELVSGEPVQFGSYFNPTVSSFCGDDANEYVMGDRCCGFKNSILKNGVCVQNDGRSGNKYLQMQIAYNITASKIDFAEPQVMNVSSGELFKDPREQPVGAYTAVVVSAANAILNAYHFDFAAFQTEVVPGPECFTNGILDYRKCDFTPRETLQFPCYDNAAAVLILDKDGAEILRKDVLGRCGL